MLRPGDFLSERYRIVEPIGAGGMGTLWRAHHVELGVDVALKVVSVRGASANTLKRFKREARAVARLQSPNVVKVFDYGEFQGLPYLAMELLQGEDLAHRLARAGKLTPDACIPIMDGIIKAVQVAHEAGIVHRDLKPANVFLERAGDQEIVKILDFGVAKELASAGDPSTTKDDGPVGSPGYMSPEQVWGQEIGPQTDVWGLGVIAFEVLSGKNPFLDETLAKTFERIIREPLPKIRDFAPHLPAAVDPVFERALARLPKDRFASAADFGDALRSALRGELAPVDAPRGGGRSRLRLALTLAAVAAVFAMGLSLLSFRRDSRDVTPLRPSVRSAPSVVESPTATVPSEPPPAPSAVVPKKANPESSAKEEPRLPRGERTKAVAHAPAPVSSSILDPRFGIPLSQGQ